MNQPKVLVLGASGQLGRAIARDALAAEFDLHLPSSAELDVRDAVALLGAVEKIRPDYVVNCAAFTAVDLAERERDAAFAVNAQGARNVAVASERFDAFLIHLSTDFVFDGRSHRPYRESDTASPINVYGESKLLGEEYVVTDAPQSCVLRVSWLFGSSSNSFVAKILARAKRRDALRVVDDQIGCPTSAAGAAEVIGRIVSRAVRPVGLFHYCGQPETTWFGFATEIVRQAHDRRILASPVDVTPISSEELGGTTRRPKYSVLNTGKLEAALGIERDAWATRLAQALDPA